MSTLLTIVKNLLLKNNGKVDNFEEYLLKKKKKKRYILN